MKLYSSTIFVSAFVLLTIASMANALAANRKITVAKDGTGNFKVISKAIDSVKDATQTNPVDIIIKPGIYVEAITTVDWVNLIGKNRDTCIIKFDGKGEKTVYQHTVWATSNTILKNLTLIGLEVKYVIHSDGGSDYVLTIDNCTLRREYPNAKSKLYPAAFGIGLKGGQHIVMKNCLLEAILPMYWHNWNEQKGKCSMTLKKCILKGKDYAVGIYNLGSQQRDLFILNDCVLTGAKGSFKYDNVRNIKGKTWNGQSETKLVGSGNKMSKPIGANIMDDTSKTEH